MKRIILFLIVGVWIAPIDILHAQVRFETLRASYESGRLTQEQYLVYSALNIFEPNQVPEEFRIENETLPLKTGTFIVQEIKANWNQLSLSAQKLLAPYFQRPTLPYNRRSPSGKFRIHYALSGTNQVSPIDNDKNNIPDYVDRTADYFDHTHAIIADSLGYNSPAPDSGGRGKEFDIYITALNRTYGITWLEESVPGKPNAYACYIEVENDFAGFKTSPLQALMVTSAHEYFHAIQVGYRYRDEDVFFMEMCSTWMEDYAYTFVNDYLLYLDNFFDTINYPFYYTNGSWFEYASCLWNHMIVKKYGAEVIRKIWQSIPQQTAFSAMQQILPQYNTTFTRELASFGLWNYFTGSRADTISYYPEGNLYPEVSFEGEERIQETSLSLDERMRKLSSIYYQIADPNHGYEFDLVITNFSEPNQNYLTTDRDSFQINFVSLPDIQKSDSAFFRRNNLVRLTENIGIQLNVNDDENWFAQAIVTDLNGREKVVQFFPPFFVNEKQTKNFINSIYPSPLIVGQNDPAFITYVVSEEKPGEIAIYSSEGRSIAREEFKASPQTYRILTWDGRNQSGDLVSSGIYLILLRVGGFVEIKKLAVVRK